MAAQNSKNKGREDRRHKLTIISEYIRSGNRAYIKKSGYVENNKPYRQIDIH